MNRARIIVLTIAIGAGGVAACPASGSDSKPTPPTAPVAQLRTVDVLAAKSAIDQAPLALRSIADVDQMEIASHDRSHQRGNINVVRYGATSSTAVQK